MILNDHENGISATAIPLPPPPHSKQRQRRKATIICLATTLFLILLVALVGFILSVTVLRLRQPRTQLVSASLEGVAPKLSFPVMKLELNVTLNLTLLVHNQNHASFKCGLGRSVLLYQGKEVGEAELNPGLIPAKGTATMCSNLILEVGRFADSGLASVFRDVMAGQIAMASKTRILGRVNLLGIFQKHVVTSSDCQFVVGFPDLNIKSQDCKYHNKL